MTHIYFLVFDFARFHYNNFRDAISCECVVKDDCVRSCLIELQSFPLSKFKVDPLHRVLDVFSTFSACTMQDVNGSSQACTDLCDPCPWDAQT